ncbi:mariner-Tc1 transposon family protein [Penicillium cinerascens]|uniref:Mariner-Tc1 transposon family protein n=1 Tax=Penicillium cinerascens TaxID=70096 RepID=A0A9W9MAT7_9EURO|nr:mariner-Tc1 transposon family protein [Penicillium cinerascens]KAJ5195640.1 mariner-Tc1 transposon family protein [Penicillium cinerascens]
MKGPPRSAITLAQKRALRRQAHEDSSISNKGLQTWFQKIFGQFIAPSSVSEILSFRYDYLDEQPCHSQVKRKKNRREQWPELEEQLACWTMWMIQQQRQKDGKEGVRGISTKTPTSTIPGRLIREKAQSLWRCIPAYRGKEVPSFSNCWILRFRERCQEKSWIQTQLGETGTASEKKEEDENQHRYPLPFDDIRAFDGESEEEGSRLQDSPSLDCEVTSGTEGWEFDDITNSDWDGFCDPWPSSSITA